MTFAVAILGLLLAAYAANTARLQLRLQQEQVRSAPEADAAPAAKSTATPRRAPTQKRRRRRLNRLLLDVAGASSVLLIVSVVLYLIAHHHADIQGTSYTYSDDSYAYWTLLCGVGLCLLGAVAWWLSRQLDNVRALVLAAVLVTAGVLLILVTAQLSTLSS